MDHLRLKRMDLTGYWPLEPERRKVTVTMSTAIPDGDYWISALPCQDGLMRSTDERMRTVPAGRRSVSDLAIADSAWLAAGRRAGRVTWPAFLAPRVRFCDPLIDAAVRKVVGAV